LHLYIVAVPCPSSVFQSHLREYLESDSETATKIIDTMLNQLNWAFSEFDRILHEVVTILLLRGSSQPVITNMLIIMLMLIN